MEQKHSPLPWKQDDSFVRTIDSGDIYVCNCISWSDLSKKLPTLEEAQANAQFIVQACNTHEVLLEACKLALSRLSLSPELFRATYSEEKAITDKLKAAIAKAEAKGGDVQR